MGIKGLLPFLSSIQERCHISEFSGQVIGIDGYCWIHRGIIGCALDLASGKETDFYVSYFMKRLKILIENGVIPVVVFDGAEYLAKSDKETERNEKRDKYLQMGKEFYEKGDIKQANQCFQHSIDACKKNDVSCVVAPFEADAQLAFLYKKGVISACISEDSDLLAFGCGTVIYKLDSSGMGVKIDYENIDKINSFKDILNEKVSFLQLCVMAGCDYLPSIKGIGMATACKLVHQHRDIYKHHWVFDHLSASLVPLSCEEITTLAIDGKPYQPPLENSIVFQIALGNVHPKDFSIIGHNHFKQVYNSEVSTSQHPKKLSQISTPASLLSLHVTSLPDINGTSPYFTKNKCIDDESILSPPVVGKRNWINDENDEDIEIYAKKLSVHGAFHSQPISSSTPIVSRPFPKPSLKLGLSKKSKRKLEPVLKDSTRVNTLYNYMNKN
ncbi:Exonuclease 1 [Thelohanellus kitauei]|uniref:Exonuclease 1 n=1 Tax=Thelohanellus kitauei TaxID=669202 RepID=A0A0C2MFA7_THEKT|nr:Exonuclease 1 [Thelohanellus kitauei]